MIHPLYDNYAQKLSDEVETTELPGHLWSRTAHSEKFLCLYKLDVWIMCDVFASQIFQELLLG